MEIKLFSLWIFFQCVHLEFFNNFIQPLKCFPVDFRIQSPYITLLLNPVFRHALDYIVKSLYKGICFCVRFYLSCMYRCLCVLAVDISSLAVISLRPPSRFTYWIVGCLLNLSVTAGEKQLSRMSIT